MKKKHANAAAAPTPEEVGAAPMEVDGLRSRLKEVEAERDLLQKDVREAREKQLRARADYENLVKRSAREAQDTVRYVKGGLLLRVADLVETLERLAQDVRGRLGPDSKGLQLVIEDARKLLRDEGLEEIPAKGQPFDYRVHQAVERVETSDSPEASVVDVVQRGYRLGEEILRPALVRVATSPPAKTSSQPSDGKE